MYVLGDDDRFLGEPKLIASCSRTRADERRAPTGIKKGIAMKGAYILSVLCLLAMTAALLNAFIAGDFASEGSALVQMPWGVLSLVDLYAGFLLFSGWIVYREASLGRALVWVVLMMVLGFFTASLYSLLALLGSKGDWQRFWLGHRAPKAGV
jgi:hypothetical protein